MDMFKKGADVVGGYIATLGLETYVYSFTNGLNKSDN